MLNFDILDIFSFLLQSSIVGQKPSEIQRQKLRVFCLARTRQVFFRNVILKIKMIFKPNFGGNDFREKQISMPKSARYLFCFMAQKATTINFFHQCHLTTFEKYKLKRQYLNMQIGQNLGTKKTGPSSWSV